MLKFDHQFPYDPGYGYSLADFMAVAPPAAEADFEAFWRERYRRVSAIQPDYTLEPCGSHAGFRVYDLGYRSGGGVYIGGWLLEPVGQAIKQAIVVGHGYGGRDEPDFHLQFPETAFLFPCFRGIGRSRCSELPESPNDHVLHGIDDPGNYVLGGCVEDLWVAVSLALERYPAAADRLGYMGISFGGGVGALAVPWDARIARAHFNVPTFGNQPLRLTLPTVGSAAAVSAYVAGRPAAMNTLAYYDAAIAAGFARQPAHFAAALFDPVVAPPGQFAVYNAWAGPKKLFLLDAGHFDYPCRGEQDGQLLEELKDFFSKDDES